MEDRDRVLLCMIIVKCASHLMSFLFCNDIVFKIAILAMSEILSFWLKESQFQMTLAVEWDLNQQMVYCYEIHFIVFYDV